MYSVLKTSLHELFIVQLWHSLCNNAHGVNAALVDFKTMSICTAKTGPNALLPRGEGSFPCLFCNVANWAA
jgi:hypothetical protein